MTAKITVEMDNAAFEDAPASELARILRELADHIEQGNGERTLFDLNGNRVGKFTIEATA